MERLLKRAGRNVKKFMTEKVKACEEILSCAQNRLILGLIFMGLGGGLIASAYIRVPE